MFKEEAASNIVGRSGSSSKLFIYTQESINSALYHNFVNILDDNVFFENYF